MYFSVKGNKDTRMDGSWAATAGHPELGGLNTEAVFSPSSGQQKSEIQMWAGPSSLQRRWGWGGALLALPASGGSDIFILKAPNLSLWGEVGRQVWLPKAGKRFHAHTVTGELVLYIQKKFPPHLVPEGSPAACGALRTFLTCLPKGTCGGGGA